MNRNSLLHFPNGRSKKKNNFHWRFFFSFRFESEGTQTFLENFEAIAQKHEQRRQKIKKEVRDLPLTFIQYFSFFKEDVESDKSPSAPFLEKPSSLTRTEYELLYIETLYTIKHKIGTTTTTSKYIQGDSDLYAYAQEAFGLSNEDHQRLSAKANEEKVCLSFQSSFN